jgi:hypothetical protein
MPKVSRESATMGGDYGPVLDQADEIEGYRVGFTTFRQDMDATPLLKGLPNDMCQCPHWGYLMFSPADEMRITEETILTNFRALQPSSSSSDARGELLLREEPLAHREERRGRSGRCTDLRVDVIGVVPDGLR